MRITIVTLFMFLLPVLASAEIYKWVDDRGQTGFSDDLTRVPKKYRDKAIISDKQEPAVEIIEKGSIDKGVKKGADGKGEQSPAADEKVKEKPIFGGKTGDAWKQDLGRAKHEVRSLEEQAVGIKERMNDNSKKSRGEYLSLQNTARDLEVRIGKAQKKLDALTEAADQAGVPAEYR